MEVRKKQDGALPRTPEDLERKYEFKKKFRELEKKASKEDVEKSVTEAKDQADQNLKSHIDNQSNPHGVTAEQVGARPNTWTPAASDVGAVPTGRKVNGKALSDDITLSASDVSARPDTWMPTASEVGARPDTWMPSASDVGARPNTWMPSASDVGAMAARPVQIEMAGSGSHGGYIDFHYGQSAADNTSRIIESASGTLSINGMTFASSDKTFKARNVYLTGTMGAGGKTSETDAKNGVIFGASGNITMQGADTPTLNFIYGSSTSPQASINLAGTSNQLHFKSKGNILLYPVSTNNTYFAFLGNSMYHSTDNAVSCGASGKRWSTVYAGTGTINTSDRNEKENIRDVDEKYIQLFEKLRPVTYEFIGGNHDRVHIGYISQEVKDAMDEVGLTDLDFAGYCRDKKTEDVLDESGALVGQKDVLDENGEPTYQYALRYAEFIALNTKMIQLQQARISELEKRLEELEKKMI